MKNGEVSESAGVPAIDERTVELMKSNDRLRGRNKFLVVCCVALALTGGAVAVALQAIGSYKLEIERVVFSAVSDSLEERNNACQDDLTAARATISRLSNLDLEMTKCLYSRMKETDELHECTEQLNPKPKPKSSGIRPWIIPNLCSDTNKKLGMCANDFTNYEPLRPGDPPP